MIHPLYDHFFKTCKWQLLVFFVLVLISLPIQGVMLPKSYANVVEALVNDSKSLSNILVTILLLSAAMMVLVLGREYLSVELFPKKLDHHMLNSIYSKILENASGSNFQMPDDGAIQSRATRLSRDLTYQMEWVIRTGIPQILGLSLIVGYLFYKHRKIGTVAIFGFSLCVAVTLYYANLIISQSQKREATMTKLQSKAMNTFKNVKTVTVNNTGSNEMNQLSGNFNAHADEFATQLNFGIQMRSTVFFISIVIFAVVIHIISNDPQRKILGPLLLMYVTYLSWMRGFFSELPFVFHRIGVLNYNLEFIQDLFEKDDDTLTRIRTCGITNGKIEFKNVSFSFKDNIVHNNICLTFPAGQFTCLSGKSGSGKSVLLQLIIQLYTADSGNIYIDNKNIASFDLQYLRNTICYVEQDANVFAHKSILDNILYGTTYNEQDFHAFLERYNISVEISLLYEKIGGIYEPVGNHGDSLSGGMRRMVTLLRALMKKSVLVYLFDEPLTGLDPSMQMMVIRLIQNVCQNKTVVFVSHTIDSKARDVCQNHVVITNNSCLYL